MHAGMDLGHPGGTGTPILNVQQGVVERVLRNDDRRRAFNGYGNGVVVHHPDDDTWALYAHMDRVDVVPGQSVAAGTRLGTMGASTNDKFPGMAPHLHLELRRRRSNGLTPFPSPYPRSLQQPFNNLDPRPWLEGRGLRFLGRGGFEILPGTEMAETLHLFQTPGMAGADPHLRRMSTGWRPPRLFPRSLSGLGQEQENAYEPPARFDRDVYFGLTPVEWAAGGATVLVGVGGLVAWWARRRLRRPVAANRRRARSKGWRRLERACKRRRRTSRRR